MNLELEIPLSWLKGGFFLIGASDSLFGIFTALWPDRSIAFYQWLMALFNWRVSPINEKHELRTTRILGILLVTLGLVLLARFIHLTGI